MQINYPYNGVLQSLKDGDCDSKPLVVNNLLFVDSFTSRYNTTNAATYFGSKFHSTNKILIDEGIHPINTQGITNHSRAESTKIYHPLFKVNGTPLS